MITNQDDSEIRINLNSYYIYSPVDGTVVDIKDNAVKLKTNQGITINIKLNLQKNSVDKYFELNQYIKRYTKIYEIGKLSKGKDFLTIIVENNDVDIIVTKKLELKANDYLLAII